MIRKLFGSLQKPIFFIEATVTFFKENSTCYTICYCRSAHSVKLERSDRWVLTIFWSSTGDAACLQNRMHDGINGRMQQQVTFVGWWEALPYHRFCFFFFFTSNHYNETALPPKSGRRYNFLLLPDDLYLSCFWSSVTQSLMRLFCILDRNLERQHLHMWILRLLSIFCNCRVSEKGAECFEFLITSNMSECSPLVLMKGYGESLGSIFIYLSQAVITCFPRNTFN